MDEKMVSLHINDIPVTVPAGTTVLEAARSLSEELRRKVTVEELARETKLSEKVIRDAVRLSGHQIEYLEEA